MEALKKQRLIFWLEAPFSMWMLVEIVEEHSSGMWLEDRKMLTGVGVKIIL